MLCKILLRPLWWELGLQFPIESFDMCIKFVCIITSFHHYLYVNSCMEVCAYISIYKSVCSVQDVTEGQLCLPVKVRSKHKLSITVDIQPVIELFFFKRATKRFKKRKKHATYPGLKPRYSGLMCLHSTTVSPELAGNSSCFCAI